MKSLYLRDHCENNYKDSDMNRTQSLDLVLLECILKQNHNTPKAIMKIIEMFSRALNNSETGYFIIDSGNYEKDHDYISYAWQQKRNNKIKPGDVFIYRKSQTLSNNGQFYFYGAGQFSRVEGDNATTGYISNSHPFKTPIMQSDLDSFPWRWKQRGATWEHYWGQYGINHITKEDFTGLLTLLNEDTYEPVEDQEVVGYDAQIAEGDFFIDDELVLLKTRSWQRAWSDRVKNNYGYTCAMCDIDTPDFLIGSHIVPVGKDKENRMNPSNGLCLCVLHDKAFDKGYITVSDDDMVTFSMRLNENRVLNEQLRTSTRSALRKPKFYKPEAAFFKHHQLHIFKAD